MLNAKAEEATIRNILAARLLGIEITWVYSPVRVNAVAEEFGLRKRSPLDLRTGFDSSKQADRTRAWKITVDEDPFVVIGSPVCAMFSAWQSVAAARVAGNEAWQRQHSEKLEAARMPVEFGCKICMVQPNGGKHFIHEHPWSASSWKLPCVKRMLNRRDVTLTRADRCMYGQDTTGRDGSNGLVCKPTGFMTGGTMIADELSARCNREHRHIQLVSGLAAGAAIYPRALCEAMCRGIVRQQIHDAQKVATSVPMTRRVLATLVHGKLVAGQLGSGTRHGSMRFMSWTVGMIQLDQCHTVGETCWRMS